MNGRPASEQALELATFVPFRLNRLATGVSQFLAAIYQDRFGLDIPQWRVIATVGGGACTAQTIAASTRMHKTRVSRAIVELEGRDLIERLSNEEDRRERQVHLTLAGHRLYTELVPLALQRERMLLSCLDAGHLHGFVEALDVLERFLGLDKQP